MLAVENSLRVLEPPYANQYLTDIINTICHIGINGDVLHCSLPMILLVQDLQHSASAQDPRLALYVLGSQTGAARAGLEAHVMRWLKSHFLKDMHPCPGKLRAHGFAKRKEEMMRLLTRLKG